MTQLAPNVALERLAHAASNKATHRRVRSKRVFGAFGALPSKGGK
jgi:hypothetical protein